MNTTPLQKAIQIAGSQSRLAERCGINQQNISYWLRNRKADKQVPAEYVIAIEKATDGEVSRHELRPDLYTEDAAA